jgi:C_GCAxxG_C_C family probable redox protein
MENRVELAVNKHKAGYNCAQAVACAYCDMFGMSEKDAFKATEGFGLGIAGTMGMCGAVCGAVFLAGLKNSDGDMAEPKTKASTYKLGKAIVNEFEEMNSSYICKELRGIEGKKLRSCTGCVEDAAKLVEKYLTNESE